MYIGNIVCLICGLASIPILMKVLKIPKKVLAPIIIIVCIVGAYANSNNMFDVWIMLVAGVLSYWLQKHKYPITPVVLGFVLAPTFELKVRQALEISNCDMLVFLRSPIALFFLLFAMVLCLAPVIMKFVKKAK